jgi:predicted metal-dependent phosphotriesterase family hydrolase
MVVKLAANPPIVMTVDQMREAVATGAFIEFVGQSLADADAPARIDRFAQMVRAIGPQSCILASDLGQKGNPLPTAGFAQFIAAMRAKGFIPAEINQMTRDNPARLLGLK